MERDHRLHDDRSEVRHTANVVVRVAEVEHTPDGALCCLDLEEPRVHRQHEDAVVRLGALLRSQLTAPLAVQPCEHVRSLEQLEDPEG